MKINFGYYGEWAKCRNLSFEEIEANIKAGKPYVLRFRSEGDPNKRFTHHDLVKGDIELPEMIRTSFCSNPTAFLLITLLT